MKTCPICNKEFTGDHLCAESKDITNIIDQLVWNSPAEQTAPEQYVKVFGPVNQQVVVVLHDSINDPEVWLLFRPLGFGTCRFSTQFVSGPLGPQAAREYFNRISAEVAAEMVSRITATMTPEP